MKKQPINPDVIKACDAIDAGVPVSEVMRCLGAVKIKGDPLEGFTGSLPFHLDRSPDAPKKVQTGRHGHAGLFNRHCDQCIQDGS